MGTSLLQRNTVKQLDRLFGCHAVQENVRPDWLIGPNGHRLELDILVPAAKIAIEVQGPQHYRFSEYHHGDGEGFKDQIRRDSQKRVVCARRGIALYEVASHSDLNELITKLEKKKVGPDPRHIEAVKRDAKAFCDRQIDWLTRDHIQRLRQAEINLQMEIKRAGPNPFLSWETAQIVLSAESKVEKYRERLATARDRASRGEGRGIKKPLRRKGRA